ncbi:FAD-dependent oxidoreductase [Streptomyces sp. NPDC002920]
MAGAIRIAVVGAGPSGVYAAEQAARLGYSVDVFDRLPCPYGLLRYGVAPDHLRMKALEVTLRRVLERDSVRFVGGVEVGRDVSVEELRTAYDGVVYAYGASADRRLGIEGEDLAGSVPATSFVRWYSGHPDASAFELTASSAVIIGMGNVALDVARILLKPVGELSATDIPSDVLDGLARSTVTDVHIVGRRGPAFARFTTKELRELGELPGVALSLSQDDLALDDEARAAMAADLTVERNLETLRTWASTTWPADATRRVHFHFHATPSRVLGSTCVEGLEVALAGGGSRTIPAQLVLRSIGYRGLSVPGVPYDAARGVVPNEAGRVLRDGAVSPGEYTVGWIRRGPSGVIGTNKADAKDTVALLGTDLGPPGESDERPDLVETLRARGVEAVTWEGWQSIDAAERALGAATHRERAKIADWDGLRSAARAGRPTLQP